METEYDMTLSTTYWTLHAHAHCLARAQAWRDKSVLGLRTRFKVWPLSFNRQVWVSVEQISTATLVTIPKTLHMSQQGRSPCLGSFYNLLPKLHFYCLQSLSLLLLSRRANANTYLYQNASRFWIFVPLKQGTKSTTTSMPSLSRERIKWTQIISYPSNFTLAYGHQNNWLVKVCSGSS